MEIFYSPGGFHGVSDQEISVTPGADNSLTGWALTPNTLSSTPRRDT